MRMLPFPMRMLPFPIVWCSSYLSSSLTGLQECGHVLRYVLHHRRHTMTELIEAVHFLLRSDPVYRQARTLGGKINSEMKDLVLMAVRGGVQRCVS